MGKIDKLELQKKKITFVEVGVSTGGSLQMWKKLEINSDFYILLDDGGHNVTHFHLLIIR